MKFKVGDRVAWDETPGDRERISVGVIEDVMVPKPNADVEPLYLINGRAEPLPESRLYDATL